MSSPTLRVASYNIRKSVGLDWVRRPDRVLATLDEIGADIVALQEVDRRFGRRTSSIPRDALRELGYQPAPVALRDGSLGWHGNALLARTGWDFGDPLRVDLPSHEPRGAVSAAIRQGKVALHAVGVHLALAHSKRRQQIGAITRHLARRNGAAPTVILGDFNAWGRRHSWVGHLPEGYRLTVPGKSFHAARPRLALDLIVTGPDVEVRASGVHDTALSRVASDHLPVWADLSVPSAP